MTTYSVYYTDIPLSGDVQQDLSLLMPVDFLTMDEALEAAFKVIYKGGVVWKIEGPQGLMLDREEIEREYEAYRHAA
ncbi:MAG: hypothetical protein PHH36_03485 [Sideroxydans sp.]|nr:hypothetical protein [Sideroxydans sp.]